MPPAARVTDASAHPGMITGPGVPTVLIGGLPAARQGDLVVEAPPNAIVVGEFTVLIG